MSLSDSGVGRKMVARGPSAKLCWTLLSTAVLALLSTYATALDNVQLMDILVTAYPDFLAGHEAKPGRGPRAPQTFWENGKSKR
jgi:hypothetical protein